jgi:SAM-dependent methyltransferase
MSSASSALCTPPERRAPAGAPAQGSPPPPRRWLLPVYAAYLRLCRTPLAPNFLFFFPLYRMVIARLRRDARGLVMDVGAGFSPFARVVRRAGATYCSLDYPSTSELSPFAAPPPGQGGHIWGDASALPLQSERCDVAICTSVLEHVSDPRTVLQELFRILRPGGRVIGSVPFGHNLHMEPYDYFRITHHGLRALGEASGFRVQEIAPAGRGVHALGACAADMLLRNVTGLKRSTIGSMGPAQLLARSACFLLVYPLILAVNLLAPLLDRLLPAVLLPVHYVFIFEKPS